MTLETYAFENVMEKEEHAGNQHFHPFPQFFLLLGRELLSFNTYLNCQLRILSIWTCLQYCRSVKSKYTIDTKKGRKGAKCR